MRLSARVDYALRAVTELASAQLVADSVGDQTGPASPQLMTAEMGKPIIHSVEDAVAVLHTTGLDALVIDDYVVRKSGN